MFAKILIHFSKKMTLFAKILSKNLLMVDTSTFYKKVMFAKMFAKLFAKISKMKNV